MHCHHIGARRRRRHAYHEPRGGALCDRRARRHRRLRQRRRAVVVCHRHGRRCGAAQAVVGAVRGLHQGDRHRPVGLLCAVADGGDRDLARRPRQGHRLGTEVRGVHIIARRRHRVMHRNRRLRRPRRSERKARIRSLGDVAVGGDRELGVVVGDVHLRLRRAADRVARLGVQSHPHRPVVLHR